MPDLTELQSAQAVEITDTNGTDCAKVNTSLPATSDPGLTVREARKGQTTMANSLPVVAASNQSHSMMTGESAVLVDQRDVVSGGPSNLQVVRNFSFAHDDNSLYWNQSLTGSATGTFATNEKAFQLNCTTASGDRIIRQSRERFVYQMGSLRRVIIGALMGAIKTNVRQRIGYFDANDGLFFEQDGTNLKVVSRTFASGAAVDTAVNQSSWNLDTLNGSGASGVTLDNTKINAFVIDVRYDGSGMAKFGFVIDGDVVFCHKMVLENTQTTSFITTAHLPVRLELENTGTAASGTTMKNYMFAVYDDAAEQDLNTLERAASHPVTGKSLTTTLRPMIAVRLKSANNRGVIKLEKCEFYSNSAAVVMWQVVLNPTLTAASFTSVAANSITEQDVAATALSGGSIIASGFAYGDMRVEISTNVFGSANIAGTADIICLALVKASGAGAAVTAQCSMRFKEYF